MKYQVSLNGKQFEVEVEKGIGKRSTDRRGSRTGTGCSSANTRGSAGSGSSTRSSACRRRDRRSAHAGHHSGYPMHGRSGR